MNYKNFGLKCSCLQLETNVYKFIFFPHKDQEPVWPVTKMCPNSSRQRLVKGTMLKKACVRSVCPVLSLATILTTSLCRQVL